MTRDWLEGNGAGFVRERALAMTVQRSLERVYQLDRMGDVDDFVEPAVHGERESVLVRESEDGSLEMCVRLPSLGPNAREFDPLCQIIEGVSHFVYLAERARTEVSTTQLELELQAEVDKYVVLASGLPRFDVVRSEALRARLFDRVSFMHDASSTEGDRYRVANDAARRFTRRLEQKFVSTRRFDDLQRELRRFFRSGQEEKLRASFSP